MAAMGQAERSPHTVRPAAVRPAQTRVRWDRVIVLIALLAVVTTVTAHALIGAVSDSVRAMKAKPQLAAAPTINVAQQAPTAPNR